MGADALALTRPGLVVRRISTWRLNYSAITFAALAATYFAAGVFLTSANVIQSDALSRVASADRVLFSRDPHLAAIGFVWSPMPVLALLPIIPLKFVWPALTTVGLAGSIVSAVCMAAAALQVKALVEDMGLGRRAVTVLVAAFAFHPLIFFFAANGMSEAMLLFFALFAVRHLARWLLTFEVEPLVKTGFALAAAYLSRYESLPAALAVVAVVSTVSFARARGDTNRFWTSACDAAIVGMPVGMAFVLWAAVSWLTVGHPFEQLASIYGNHAQMQIRPAPAWSPSLARLVGSQVLLLEGLLPIVVLLRATLGRFRHDAALIAVTTGIAPILAFMVVADMNGSIDNELRYFIFVVPLTVLLAGTIVTFKSTNLRPSRARNWSLRLAAVSSVLASLVALPVAGAAMLEPTVDPIVAFDLRPIVLAHAGGGQGNQSTWIADRQIATTLDSLDLPAGAVLVDDFLGFPIVVASENPRQFVITSDRDFEVVLSDPVGTGIRYVLTPNPNGLGSLDAVNRKYPAMYSSGAGLGTLVAQYGPPGSEWRLYRVG